MAFKSGTIAFVKTTEEPVFVLGVSKNAGQLDSVPDLSDDVVRVRRPLATTEGLKYQYYDFYAEELESAEDKHQRYYNEMSGRVKAFEAQATPADQSALPS